MLRSLLACALLTACAGALAQAPARGIDCSRAKDPAACEERVAKAKAARAKARQACAGTKGDEGRDCMRREMCAQTRDPSACETRAKEAAARRAQVREACRGKAGEELKSCVREQYRKK